MEKVKITFPLRISPALRDDIAEAAYLTKVSRQQLCQDAIRAWVDKIIQEARLK